jgi:hypothetical protein
LVNVIKLCSLVNVIKLCSLVMSGMFIYFKD